MSSNAEVHRLAERLRATLLKDLRQDCGEETAPGVDEVPEWQVFSHRETSTDQLLIEQYLDSALRCNSSVLHIGIGNSSLAAKFSSRVQTIFGTTIHHQEKQFADELLLPNFRVEVINKYSTDMQRIEGQFDFIVDNNPASYCCCYFHFARMLLSYSEKLAPDGLFLSAAEGLNWVVPHNTAEWSLDYSDWRRICQLLNLRSAQVAHRVFSMRRRPPNAISKRFSNVLGRMAQKFRSRQKTGLRFDARWHLETLDLTLEQK
jgi:hypothetical protein